MKIKFEKLLTTDGKVYVDFGEGYQSYNVADIKDSGIEIPTSCEDYSNILIKGNTKILKNLDMIKKIEFSSFTEIDYPSSADSISRILNNLSIEEIKEACKNGKKLNFIINHNYTYFDWLPKNKILLYFDIPIEVVENAVRYNSSSDLSSTINTTALFIGNPFLAGIEGYEDNGCDLFGVVFPDRENKYFSYTYPLVSPIYTQAELERSLCGKIRYNGIIHTMDNTLNSVYLDDLSANYSLGDDKIVFIK